MSVDFPQHPRPWIALVMTCNMRWVMGQWFPVQGLDVADEAAKILTDHSSRVNYDRHRPLVPDGGGFSFAPMAVQGIS